jgi:hypothetical protein
MPKNANIHGRSAVIRGIPVEPNPLAACLSLAQASSGISAHRRSGKAALKHHWGIQ